MWRGTVAVNPWNQVRGCSHHQASGVRFPNLAVILISLNLAWCGVVVVDHDGDMSHGAGVGVMILICQAGSRHSLISGSVSPSPGVTCHVSRVTLRPAHFKMSQLCHCLLCVETTTRGVCGFLSCRPVSLFSRRITRREGLICPRSKCSSRNVHPMAPSPAWSRCSRDHGKLRGHCSITLCLLAT